MRRVAKLPLAMAVCASFLGTATLGATVDLVRITPEQYRNSIRDIFGSSIEVDGMSAGTGARENGLLALGNRKISVTATEFEQFDAAAQQIAAQVVAPKHNATLIHCKPRSATSPDDACASQFFAEVGPRVFRRPLTDAEVHIYVGLASRSTGNPANFYTGLATGLATMLVSPQFLFRVERAEPIPTGSGSVQLDAYSKASRLSFFLWNTTPDDELLAAAGSGVLRTPRGMSRQVDRLLDSPRAQDGLRAFFSDMLGFDRFATLSKDAQIFPQFTNRVAANAKEETLRMIADHLLVKNRDYRDLFISKDTFLTPSLAALYGVALPYPAELRSADRLGADRWVPYAYPQSDHHFGILTQASFLALNSHAGRSSPTLRGKAVRELLLCQRVPPPPGNVNFNIVQDTHNPLFKTARQRLTAHRTEPLCAGCHKITDPIGLGLETFDSAGEYRTTENEAPIDSSGEIDGKSFENLEQLALALRNDPAVAACLITRAFSYGVGRVPAPDDRTWLTELQKDLSQRGLKWRDLMRAMASAPSFFSVVDRRAITTDVRPSTRAGGQ